MRKFSKFTVVVPGFLAVAPQLPLVDREEMLRTVGVSSVEELFRDIPAGVRLDRGLRLEPPLSEQEVFAHLSELAARNADTLALPVDLLPRDRCKVRHFARPRSYRLRRHERRLRHGYRASRAGRRRSGDA